MYTHVHVCSMWYIYVTCMLLYHLCLVHFIYLLLPFPDFSFFSPPFRTVEGMLLLQFPLHSFQWFLPVYIFRTVFLYIWKENIFVTQDPHPTKYHPWHWNMCTIHLHVHRPNESWVSPLSKWIQSLLPLSLMKQVPHTRVPLFDHFDRSMWSIRLGLRMHCATSITLFCWRCSQHTRQIWTWFLFSTIVVWQWAELDGCNNVHFPYHPLTRLVPKCSKCLVHHNFRQAVMPNTNLFVLGHLSNQNCTRWPNHGYCQVEVHLFSHPQWLVALCTMSIPTMYNNLVLPVWTWIVIDPERLGKCFWQMYWVALGNLILRRCNRLVPKSIEGSPTTATLFVTHIWKPVVGWSRTLNSWWTMENCGKAMARWKNTSHRCRCSWLELIPIGDHEPVVIGTNDRIVCTTFDHVLWYVVIFITRLSIRSEFFWQLKCGLARVSLSTLCP